MEVSYPLYSSLPKPKEDCLEDCLGAICLDMQRHQFQQHTRTYPAPSLSMKVFNNMKRPTKGYSGQEVALFPTMIDITAPSTSPSRITSSPSPSPEHSPSPTPSPSPDPTPAHTTSDVTITITNTTWTRTPSDALGIFTYFV
ncbi:hypothetical protein Tco_0181144 [Tanacetum coccineum]